MITLGNDVVTGMVLSRLKAQNAGWISIRSAQMAPFQTLRLLEAAREAGKQPGVDICCEAVDLTPEQVEAMCLQSGRDKIA